MTVESMDSHALTVLGYRELLEQVAGYAQGPLGAGEILSLAPSSDLAVIRRNRGIYEDMLALMESPASLPCLRVPDIGALIASVRPTDAVLVGEDLVEFTSVLGTVCDVEAFFASEAAQKFANLQKLAQRLDGCRPVLDSLRRCLNPDGTVLDSATPELRQIRREIGGLEQRLQKMLDDMMKDSAVRDILQDQFITQRNGRFVMPVKRTARGQMPGLVHDMSGSGQTVFVEPSSAVPLGNDLATLKLRERDEIRRILRSLSERLRNCADAISEDMVIVGKLDGAAAIARWAMDYGCVLPSFGDMFVLRKARHPLLMRYLREEGGKREIVPLDIEFPKHVKVMAITGSNTGGKTVALKTAGLLALCAQTGLPVPAAKDSLFPVFDYILADIGDEQSMTSNLSTFSAHVKAISGILQAVQNGRALVLLDELGSGTDPVEGGALACGILDQLAFGDSLTIATTHLGLVKNFVHARGDMMNAAVRFNGESLKPEYVLDVGRPGASHAMHIAKKNGMPSGVLQVAEGMMSGEQLKLEDMLARMETEQHQLAAKAKSIASLKAEWEEKHKAVTAELEKLRKTRKELMNEAYKRADALVDNARRDLENLVRRIREEAKKSGGGGESVDAAVAEARAKLEEKRQKIAIGASQSAAKPPAPLRQGELVPNKKIWIEKLQGHGRIESVAANGKSVVVSVNGIQFTMKSSDLSKATEPDLPEKNGAKGACYIPRMERQTSHELNCVGMRVDEALDAVQAFLSDCALAGLDEVRIVHGFGTGRLKNGIHEFLRTQKCVRSYALGRDFKDSGGAGVTIVQL